MGVTLIQNAEEFQAQLHNAEGKPVLVDFTAAWCGPCRFISPKLDELSTKYPNVIIIKVDVDQCPDIAQKHGISAMPTFLAFKNGEKVGEVVGANEAGIVSLLEKLS